jgi:UDP-hydrolysing UDP-N-acetyl-D-glucosamine 2-epimerase
MKRICFALTNRTNYSKLKLIMNAFKSSSDIDLRIVASSTILLERYGSAFTDLLNDGYVIDRKIDCILMNDSHESMAKTVGLSIIEHSTYFASIKPDLLVIVGDRFDMLAPVVSASMMNIPIAHIQGGELSGTIDSVIRDVFTKFAALHFVATADGVKNLMNYGVKKDTIFDFGCPAVEYVASLDVGSNFNPKMLAKKFKTDISIKLNEQYFLVMIHPDTKNKNDVDMNKILDIVSNFKIKALIFYPNVDANNSLIVSGISKYKNNPNFYMIKHMPLEGFVHAIAHSCCMISNSSAGIREAASFGTPVINVGFRQDGRERNSNTIDVGNDYMFLEETIKKYINYKFPKKNIYFKKNCSDLIVRQILKFLD